MQFPLSENFSLSHIVRGAKSVGISPIFRSVNLCYTFRKGGASPPESILPLTFRIFAGRAEKGANET